MANGLLSIDHQSLKEAISSNNNEVAQTVRVVAQSLCDTLPLCIDPNSGSLNYTGKRIEDDGDSKTSKALNSLDEELEKERAELDSRLKIVDELISYSNKLIDDLMYQPAMITCEG
jgi:flagellar capping protein FliD